MYTNYNLSCSAMIMAVECDRLHIGESSCPPTHLTSFSTVAFETVPLSLLIPVFWFSEDSVSVHVKKEKKL